MTFQVETCRFNLCFYYIILLTEIYINKVIYRINKQRANFVQKILLLNFLRKQVYLFSEKHPLLLSLDASSPLCFIYNYRIFSNLIRTLFTVLEGQKIRCGLE